MHVTRIEAARPYQAPRHLDMRALRLQGFDASPSESFWVGLSHFLPGGGAEPEASPLEKVYVVLEGAITVITDDGEQELGPLDSCHIAAGERRSIENRTNRPASMLVVMPYPEGRRS
jgi:quercetin dioxygenase-like cupin family protein